MKARAVRETAGAPAGSALVEALVALVLIALAGLMVATAAVAGLRATQRAATLGRVTALAAREIAARSVDAAAAASGVTALTVPGFAEPVTSTAEVDHAPGLTTLAVTIAGGRPSERVTLTTRVPVDE